ncbi:DNA utilization protein GntX [Kingella potus]|uniref:DNA utilization protein GntX n=2 Tax=Kingella potus TaxID=265175 RepID=A0A377R102_9NEIS|nr:DNA utilization protein GntX [Kingella potus]
MFSKWKRLFEPERCALCHARAFGGICGGCMADLLKNAVPPERVCPQCGGTGDGIAPCGACQKKPPPFDLLWSSCFYEPPISGILHEFKHLGRIGLRRPLACTMAALPPPWLNGAHFDGILAMPLSRARLTERGFNQCAELARLVAPFFRLDILPEDTVFRRPSVPQSTLPYKERRKNAAGLFEVHACVKKRNLLLIDDVATTNATLAELARTLKRAGAARVCCWTLAQAKMQKS